MAYPDPPTDPVVIIATDAAYDAPADDWDAAPTKVAPTVAIEAQGYVPGDPRPADVDNYLFNTLARWVVFLVAYVTELATLAAARVVGPASSTDNRFARFDGTTGKLLQNGLVGADDSGNVIGVTSIAYGSTQTGKIFVPGSAFWFASESAESNTTSWTSAYYFSWDGGLTTIHAMVDSEIPDGAIITGAKVAIDPGDARSGADRIEVELISRQVTISGTSAVAGSATTIVNGFQAPSTPGIHAIDISSGLSYTVNKASGTRLYAHMRHGDDALVDILWGVELTYTYTAIHGGT